MIQNVYRSSCKVLVFFSSDFHETWISSTDFRKNTRIPHFYEKNRPAGAELLYVDGRTHYDEANGRFSRLCERAPEQVLVPL